MLVAAAATISSRKKFPAWLPYWSLNGKFDWASSLLTVVLRFSIINRTTMVTFDPFALEAFNAASFI